MGKSLVIGFGGMGRLHAEMLAQAGESVSVFAHKPKSDFNDCPYPITEGLEESIRESDNVIIATPHDKHLLYSLEAIKQNKNILLEKPIAQNLETAKKIKEALDNSNARILIAEQFDFIPFGKVLKNTSSINNYEIIAHTSFKGDGWRANPDQGEGVLLDLGIHFLAFADRFIAPIETIKTVNERKINNVSNAKNIEIIHPGINGKLDVCYGSDQDVFTIEVNHKFGKSSYEFSKKFFKLNGLPVPFCVKGANGRNHMIEEFLKPSNFENFQSQFKLQSMI